MGVCLRLLPSPFVSVGLIHLQEIRPLSREIKTYMFEKESVIHSFLLRPYNKAFLQQVFQNHTKMSVNRRQRLA